MLSDSDTVINAPPGGRAPPPYRHRRGHHRRLHRRPRRRAGYLFPAGRPGPHHRHGLRPAHAGGLSLPEHLCPADRAAHPAGDGVPEPQPLQPAAGYPSGHEQPPPPSAKLSSTTATPPISAPCRTTTTAAWSCWIPPPAAPCSARTVRYTAKENDSPSSYIDPEGGCVNSLAADGCDIQGSVKTACCSATCVLKRVPAWKTVSCSRTRWSSAVPYCGGVITDKYVTVSENVTLMGHERYPIVIAKGATV